MAERLTLIERLENLDGPDREVDALIWCVEVPEIERVLPHWTEEQQEEIVPRFTGSLDEAVALVGRMLTIGEGPGKWHWYADDRSSAVWPDGFYDESAVEAATPAIALLVALFRARSEGGNKP